MADESTRKVQLGVEVDSTKARAGFEEVSKSAQSMARSVEESGRKAGGGLDGVAKGSEQAAQRLDRSTKSIIAQIQRVTAEMQAGEKGSATYFESLARQRGANVDALRPYLAQLDAAKSKQNEFSQSLMNTGMSARATAAALRTVPAQFTDIVTSLQSGQAPLTVLLQQGGQLKDQFGGVGAAAQALGRYIAGLVNPFTVAAGALGALAFAAYQGSEEFREFQKTLILSGDRAGVTADQLMQIADSIDQMNDGITRARAAEVLNEIVRSGVRGEDQIRRLTDTAARFEQVGGGAAEEVAKAFKSLADDPLGASLKLNEAIGFLTESTYKQIKALVDQGRTVDAATVAINEYASALETRIPKLQDNLGSLQRAWGFVKRSAAEAWDSMLGIGRAETAGDRIADIERRLRERATSAPAFGETYAQRERETQRLRQELFRLRTEAARESLGARDRGEAAQREKERIAFLAAGDKFLDSEAKKQKEIAQIQQLRLRNVISEAEAKERIAKIEQSYAKGGSSRAGGGRSTENRELKEQADLLATLSGVNRDYVEQLARVQSMRESGLITEQQSIDLLIALIEKQPMARDLMNEQAEATKRLAQEQAALAKAEQDRINAAERSAAGVQDQVQKLLDEERALTIAAASNISLAQAIEEVNIARLREQQAQLMAQGDRDAEVLAIQKEIDARKQLQQAIGRQEARNEAKKAADEAAKEWQKTADAIEQTLTDALMRGFESGKGFGESLADSIVNTFKTYVAREIAKAISNAILSAIAGQNWAGLIGGVLGGNGGGGYGSLLSGANNASSLTSAYNTFANGAGSNYGAAASWATGGMSTANLAGSIYANAATAGMSTGSIAASGAGIDALLATNAAYGTAASAGAAAGTAGAGAASAGAAGATSALAAIPVWGWVAIAAIALWQPLFGRKLKEVGTQINFREGDISTNDYKFEKGGWFRSDKTTMLGDTTDANKQLVQQAENIQESAKGMARALGFGTDAIDSFSGTVNVNMKGVKSNEEAAQRYNEALMELQRQMLNAATGANMSKEAFAEWINGINQSIADAGISTQGIADILVQGMMGRLSQQEVGDQLADMIVGGIYNSIASNYAAQIASVFTSQIITPIFTALAAGVPISQAISQQAIANVVQTAQQAAAAMNAIFSDPGFRSAISGIEQAIGGVSAAVTSVRIPKFGSARTAASNAAAQAANQEAQERYNLETKLLQLLGNTARLRERELAGLSASNRALQLRIWALEDAKGAVDGAMSALERAVDKQKETLQTQLDTALEAESALNDVFQTLRDNIKELRGEVDSTAGISAEDGRNRIQQAISGAIKLSNDELVDAIDAVRGGLENEVFGSQFERDRAFLRFASELESLAGVTEDGLSEAERQVMLMEEQIAALDAQVEIAQQQVEALFGIDNSVKTVAQAVTALNVAMAGYAQAVAAAQQVATSAGAAPSSGGGGGYSGGGGGGYSAPAAAKQWTADGYWAKNPDLQKEFVSANLQNSPQFNQDPELSARDEYLKWHWANFGQKERRAYAKGGYYPGGLALVGEEGPELINFRNPGQVYTASQTADLLKAGGDKEVVKAIESLRADQRAQSASMVRMQSQLNKIFSRWDVAGVPEQRVTA